MSPGRDPETRTDRRLKELALRPRLSNQRRLAVVATGGRMMRQRRNDAARFWSKVDAPDPDGCRLWKGHTINRLCKYGIVQRHCRWKADGQTGPCVGL
jgi:hypothetical protein